MWKKGISGWCWYKKNINIYGDVIVPHKWLCLSKKFKKNQNKTKQLNMETIKIGKWVKKKQQNFNTNGDVEVQNKDTSVQMR